MPPNIKPEGLDAQSNGRASQDDTASENHASASDSDQPPPPPLGKKLLGRNALRDMPKPEPLIDNALDQGTVALLYGHWGTCKSFIALDWAASIATGRSWQNRETKRRKVLYIAAEGAFGISARADAWESGWQTVIPDEDFSVLREPVNLTISAEVDALLDLVKWGRYGFIVLDTLARSMVGAEENSAKDGGIVLDAMIRLRQATPDGRGCVLGVHHTGKDTKTFRGTVAFEAGADTVYSTTDDGGTITLNREKRKDGLPDDTHTLRLQLIGESAVLAAHHVEADRGERADALLVLFVDLFSKTGASGSDLKAVALESGMSWATYKRALNELVAGGALVSVGTYHRPFYRVRET